MTKLSEKIFQHSDIIGAAILIPVSVIVCLHGIAHAHNAWVLNFNIILLVLNFFIVTCNAHFDYQLMELNIIMSGLQEKLQNLIAQNEIKNAEIIRNMASEEDRPHVQYR